MRQKIDIEQRKCDNCQKMVEQSAMSFGGSAFEGWFTVERSSGSTRMPRTDNGPWDFCSVQCFNEFLAGNGCKCPDSFPGRPTLLRE